MTGAQQSGFIARSATPARSGRSPICIVQPMRWDDFGDAGGIFRMFRSVEGERLILDQNAFVERVLPRAILRTLKEDEMAAYRAPYGDREARLPTLIWPRQIPIEGEPADVTAIVERYGKWLSKSRIPKLFIAGDPGAILTESASGRAFCQTWANQRELTVKGRHFLQEDSPDQIGEALRDFVTALEPRAST